jgi:hypothetical protein
MTIAAIFQLIPSLPRSTSSRQQALDPTPLLLRQLIPQTAHPLIATNFPEPGK